MVQPPMKGIFWSPIGSLCQSLLEESQKDNLVVCIHAGRSVSSRARFKTPNIPRGSGSMDLIFY